MKKTMLYPTIILTFFFISNNLGQSTLNANNHQPAHTSYIWQKTKRDLDSSSGTLELSRKTFSSEKLQIYNHNKQYFDENFLTNAFNDKTSDSEVQNWEKVNGPEGGCVRKFYKYYDSLYCLTDREIYVYRIDRWIPLNFEDIGCNFILCFYVDSTRMMYAGTDFQLMTSDDNGKNWVSVVGELSNTAITDIIELDYQNLLIVTRSGIFNKEIDKDYYVKLNSELPNINNLTFQNKNTVWACTWDGVYRAEYPELIWTRVNLDTAFYQKILINKRGTLYTNNGYNLCKSTDNGETWEYMAGINFTDIILEGDSDLIATDMSMLLRVNEKGVYWSTSLKYKVLLTTFLNNESEFYVGELGSGAYKYNTIEDVFTSFSEGLQSSTFRAIEILKNKTIFTITDANTYYISYNEGVDWIPIKEGWSRCTKQDACGDLYVADGSGLIKFTDYGESWITLPVLEEPFYISAMDISDDCNTICVGYSSGDVYVSNNKGETFNKILHRNYNWVEAVEILNNGTIIFQRDLLYYTNDNGNTLKSINDNSLYATAMIQDNAGNIYMAAYPGIYKSRDGLHWSYLSSNKIGVPATFKLDSLDNLYAVFGGGRVIKTQDKGKSWTTMSNNILNTSTWSFDFDNQGNMYCGSQEKGLYYCKINVEKTKGLIKSYELSNNYPNPFNSLTQIEYTIPHLSNVIIKVYDVLGNEIETLVSEQKDEGNYTIAWNAANYSSGIYFYRIQTDSFVETKKMVLLK